MSDSPLPYKIVIGLEVHVQLKTATKLFCRCSTQFGAAPNTQVCPVCLGLPGSLPVLNRRAIEFAILAGTALHCDIAPFTKWDRKNYFYPDLPKGYQTSQFDLPICARGYMDIPSTDSETGTKRVRIIRAHLEEDAGKSLHDEVTGKSDTRIDLNRAGTPLLEIVSEPDLSSAEEAKNYLTEMRLLMVYLGVSDGNMQEGSLRADANVNLHLPKNGKSVATPIVEIKNLNSFRAVERAIAYEVERQYRVFQETGLEIGQSPKQTRGWNEGTGETELQREKEDSADYRYFPCPDLAPVTITPEQIEGVAHSASRTPSAARQRLTDTHQVRESDAQVLVQQGAEVVEYLESVIHAGASAKRATAWMLQDVLRYLNESDVGISDYPVSAITLAQLLVYVESGKLDTARGREALGKLIANPGMSVESAVESLGIVQVDTTELELLCDTLLAENPDVIKKVKEGNEKAISSLIGQAKKKNRNADPKQVQEICLRKIASLP